MDERVATERSMPGRRKAAILLVSLGSEGAAEVFRHLSERHDRAAHGRDGQDAVRRARAASRTCWRRSSRPAYARGYIAEGGLRFAREVLERRSASQRAGEILNRLSAVIEADAVRVPAHTPPDQIAAFLRNEHPQTIAWSSRSCPTTALAAKVMELLDAGAPGRRRDAHRA